MPKNPTQKKVVEKQFAKNYVKTGGNGTISYQMVKPNVTRNSASSIASELLKRPSVQRSIVAAMDKYGVDEEKLSEKVSQLLSFDPEDKLSVDAVDKGLKHARAILGVDAERKSHLRIDKRSVNLNVDIASSSLQKLIKKTS